MPSPEQKGFDTFTLDVEAVVIEFADLPADAVEVRQMDSSSKVVAVDEAGTFGVVADDARFTFSPETVHG